MDRPAARRELPLLLELAGLCGLAVALRSLDVLGHSPDFLVLERLAAGDRAGERPAPDRGPGLDRLGLRPDLVGRP
jgi:hypothetical protein